MPKQQKKIAAQQKKLSKQQQKDTFVKSCATFGKFTSIIMLGLMTIVFTGLFLYALVVNKKVIYPFLGVIVVLILSLFLTVFLYNKFPAIMCYLLIFNIVVSAITGIIDARKS